VAHPLLRRAYDLFWGAHLYTKVASSSSTSSTRPHGLTQGLSPIAAADARLEQRISFDFPFAFLFLIALHGFSSVKVLLILYLNFSIAKKVPQKYIPAATWVFNIGILFANEIYGGYPYYNIVKALSFQDFDSKSSQENWGTWLDEHHGLIPRWQVLFNLTVLRLISFNMDHYWGLNMNGGSPIEVNQDLKSSKTKADAQKKKQIDPSDLSEKDRVNIPAKSQDYSFRNYIAYTLYAPLYLAGPILTYNDYISQLRYTLPSITLKRTFLYAIRFFVVFLTMEVVIHYIYAVAIAKAQPEWGAYTPFQLSMLGYFNLHHIWLKLLIPWRFFRLWALIDGIDPPENMVRCMSNNYSALAFWRGWHRSFNRWIVRYIFIPLGGSWQRGRWAIARTVVNFLLVFMFVALWHDINLRLLMWGWLITIFVIPEISATMLFPAKKWKDSPNAYRWLCGAGAIGNILMMMIANLVGYALGVDGLKGLLHGMIGSTAGLVFFAGVCGSLFIGSQVMFEVREQEKRDGILMPC
jgi:D-alanyl-lipoteichoic acid acyltransferase DltB (MBOAT superfamily)